MNAAPGAGGDTIVAPCTAAGAGGRAIVRLSGPRAHALTDACLVVQRAPALGRAGSASLALGGGAALPLLLLRWWAPRSLTGEDVSEVHLPAWPVVVTYLLRRLVEAGARPAGPGEFSRRAVACGKLDLQRAQALQQLMAARDIESAMHAAAGLAAPTAEARARLVTGVLDTLAQIEAHVDFEDEDTEAIDLQRLAARLESLRVAARELAERGGDEPARDGSTEVVLFGPPNVGKSLLFNRLAGATRAAVSPQPGTTRDALQADVTRAGRHFRLMDGPGVEIGPVAGMPSAGARLQALDHLAMQRFAARLPPDAVVLLVEDAAAPADPAGRKALRRLVAGRTIVPVLNKVDLLPPASDAGWGAETTDAPSGDAPGGEVPTLETPLRVSALRGSGLDALWDAVLRAAPVPRAPDVAEAGVAEAAREIVPVLDAVLAGRLDGALPELSLVLRDVLDRLEREEDARPDRQQQLLDRILAGFCIGK